MWWPSLICFSFALILSVLGIFRYINISKQPLTFSIPLVISIYLPISIIYLLPSDYISTNSTTGDVKWFQISAHVLLILWKSNYWITFLLTWLILPLIQEYFRSGNYKPALKIVDSLRANLKFQLIMLGVSIVGLIYLMINIGLNVNRIKLLIIAMSHIYSLIIALWLMSHGLINIPRRKWLNGSLWKRLDTLYLRLPKNNDELEDAKVAFKEQVLQVMSLEVFVQDLQYRDWIYSLIGKIPGELYSTIKATGSEIPTLESNFLNSSFLVKLTTNFNKSHHKLVATEAEFYKVINEVIDIEDTLNARSSKKLIFRSKSSIFSPHLTFILYYYIEPLYNRAAAIFLAVLSLLIIESELFHSTKLSFINTLITKKLSDNESLKLLVCVIILSYMCISALTSLTRIKVFNMYHLSSNSDPVSACFYAIYSSRLTLPLSYNFLTLFITRNSQFEIFYGNSIHLTGLTNYLNNWLPRLILIPILLTSLNIYDKLKRKLGFDFEWDNFDDFLEDDTEITASNNSNSNRRDDFLITEAKRIVSNEINKRELGSGLRPFNLNAYNRNENSNNQTSSDISNYADVQYDANIQSFNQSLLNNTLDSFSNYEEDLEPTTPFVQSSEIIRNLKNSLVGLLQGSGNHVRINDDNEEENPLVI